nr:hypothetical protein BaRGS_030881 [Batillaria attramentaria]
MHYLSSKPQLTCQVLLHNIVWKLDTEIATGAGKRDRLIHHPLDDGEDFVLAGTQLTDQCLTSLGIFATVEAVQFCCHGVQLFISKVELS